MATTGYVYSDQYLLHDPGAGMWSGLTASGRFHQRRASPACCRS